MKRVVLVLALAVATVGCGEKIEQMKQQAENIQNATEALQNVGEAQNEADQFYKERQAKGDTVAMSTDELKTYLPTSIPGYKPQEDPSVSSSNTTGWSMTTAEQTWASTTGDTLSPANIKVSLVDLGGALGAYQMMGAQFIIDTKTEDAHRRAATVKLDVPYSKGFEEFDKDSKTAKFTAVTRYRYFITVEATNQTDDQSALVKDVALDIVKKFEGK